MRTEDGYEIYKVDRAVSLEFPDMTHVKIEVVTDVHGRESHDDAEVQLLTGGHTYYPPMDKTSKFHVLSIFIEIKNEELKNSQIQNEDYESDHYKQGA